MVQELKRPVRKRARGQAPDKFGGLNFYDPDHEVMFMVHTGNMDWERRHGYVALDMKDEDKAKDAAEPFWFDWLCDTIKEVNKQPEGAELVKERPEE